MNVAKKNADLYLHNSRIYKWDVCAANAFINSMEGGKMTDISGSEINYASYSEKHVNGLIVATSNFDFYLKKILNESKET